MIEKNLRIGIDIRSLIEGKITGVEVYLINLLKALFELDQKNQYVLFYNSFKKTKLNLPFLNRPNVQVRGFGFPNRLLNLSLHFLKYPKIDKLLGGLDLFFSPRYLFLSLSKNCRHVMTTHDLSFVHFPEFFSTRQRLWHKLISDQKACFRADKIIAVSNSTKKDLTKLFGVQQEKIEVIYSGIDRSTFNTQSDPESQDRVMRKYSLSRGYILFLGTIEPRKNVLGVLAAYERLRQSIPEKVDLVLAGALGWLYEKTLRRISQSPYQDDIRLLSAVAEEDKPALYRMASVFVFPSYYEGFGFPPLEAMASGVPVVASANSSFPEVLGSACLYVDPFHTNQIFEAMRALITEEPLRKKFIAAGLARVKLFDWKKTAEQTLRVFESSR